MVIHLIDMSHMQLVFKYINVHVISDIALQAYVQQLESSRLKLMQLEQELDRARQQVWGR